MMGALVSTMTIIIAVAISNIVAKLVPKISGTYVNLIMGFIFGLIPYTDSLILRFDSDVFMFFIIAPLLFFEGQRTRNFIVRKQSLRIIGLSVVLATVTAIVVGLTINQVFKIVFPLALVMAAISTPTDATAFDSVVDGLEMSNKVSLNLKMESLFNDATGIILLTAGLAWFKTGHLSFANNLVAFLISAVGGIIFGIIVSFVLMLFRQRLIRSNINVISSQTLIFILTPFIIYYLAEEIHVSGIIAVVCAGLVSNSESSRSRFSAPHQFHLGVQIINLMTEVLNSFVFVILGVVLIRIVRGRFTQMTQSFNWLWIGVIIYVVSLVIRFIYAKFILKNSLQESLVFSLGGVHGAVTMGMVFSVSAAEITQHNFNVLVLAETVVIILSMIVPTTVFKLILPKTTENQDVHETVSKMRAEMVARGIAVVEKMDIDDDVKQSVIYDLRDQNDENSTRDFLQQWQGVNNLEFNFDENKKLEERRALMYAFSEERKYLHDLALTHKFDSRYTYSLTSEILLSESLVLDPVNQQ